MYSDLASFISHLLADGKIQGTPTTQGTYTFSITYNIKSKRSKARSQDHPTCFLSNIEITVNKRTCRLANVYCDVPDTLQLGSFFSTKLSQSGLAGNIFYSASKRF